MAERSAVIPGDTFKAALHMDLDPGWHVYWRNAGDSGFPPTINWQIADGATPDEFLWPAPHEQPLESLMNYGFEEHLTLPFEVSVPPDYEADLITLTGQADWLICLEICIPEQALVSLTLPVSDTHHPILGART